MARTILSASVLAWQSAGRPSSARGKIILDDGPCAVCAGRLDRKVSASVALPRSSFSGQDALAVPTSDKVCEACAWSMEGRPPKTLRMWSVVYREDGRSCASAATAPDLGPRVCLINKADPAPALDVLLAPPVGPWFCALADSGKIHVLPYATVNHGRGRWVVRFERENIPGTSRGLASKVYHAAHLLRAGFSKRDVSSREPSPARVAKLGIDLWREHVTALGPRPDALERLAIFLLRKETRDEYIERTAGGPG